MTHREHSSLHIFPARRFNRLPVYALQLVQALGYMVIGNSRHCAEITNLSFKVEKFSGKRGVPRHFGLVFFADGNDITLRHCRYPAHSMNTDVLSASMTFMLMYSRGELSA